MIVHDVHQNTPEWLALRGPIPTASDADRLITPAKLQPTKSLEDYAYELAVAHFETDIAPGDKKLPWEGDWVTERGHRLEADSRTRFTLDTNLRVIPGSFVTNDLMTCGCSPDGIIPSKARKKDNGLEIKNPLPKEFMRVSDHIDEHGIPPKEYMPQCYFSLYVTGYKQWHFMVDHPHFEPAYAVIFPKPEVMEVIHDQVTALMKLRNTIIERFAAKVRDL